jgi:hypothetical protein
VASWSFLTNHARVLLRIAEDPGTRLRDIAADLGITERSAYGIVTDLTQAGYVIKQKDGRRNRYQIQAHLPLPDPVGREPAIGDVLAVLMGENASHEQARSAPLPASPSRPIPPPESYASDPRLCLTRYWSWTWEPARAAQT